MTRRAEIRMSHPAGANPARAMRRVAQLDSESCVSRRCVGTRTCGPRRGGLEIRRLLRCRDVLTRRRQHRRRRWQWPNDDAVVEPSEVIGRGTGEEDDPGTWENPVSPRRGLSSSRRGRPNVRDNRNRKGRNARRRSRGVGELQSSCNAGEGPTSRPGDERRRLVLT